MADSTKSDIVFVASCNVDLISYVDKMPKIGETIMGNRFKMGFGGKGANKAIACARLGSSCSIIAKLGDDVFGKDYLNNFKENNIDTSHIKLTSEAATGVAPICVDQTGNNSIIVILGANLLLNKADIEQNEELISSAKLLVTNLEIPIETAFHSLKLARSHKSKVQDFVRLIAALFDEHVPLESIKKVCESDQSQADLFEVTDYLILNEVEVEELSESPISKDNVVEDAKKASKILLQKLKVKKGVIVTLGESGVLFTSVAKPDSSLHVKGRKANVVDTTGAGDAFVGSFAHFLNKLGEESIEQALELASSYASLTVESCGTQTSYPTLDKLEKKFHC